MKQVWLLNFQVDVECNRSMAQEKTSKLGVLGNASGLLHPDTPLGLH